MSGFARHVFMSLMALTFAASTSLAQNAPNNTPASELLAFHVKDHEFKPIEVAPWVRENVIQAFLSIEMIDEAATWGVNVVHGSGPDPYYPLMKDDPRSGPLPEVRQSVKEFVAKARKHNMRVLVGIRPYAPVELVKAHPEWMVCPTSDVEAIHARALLDLTKAQNIGYRWLGLNSPYGHYLIECLAEIIQEFGVDGFSFDGNYHPAINFAPYERELYERETGHRFPDPASVDNLEYRVYLIWAGDKLENWYRKCTNGCGR